MSFLSSLLCSLGVAEEQIEVDYVNPQDFSGSQESLSQYPGSLLQPLRSAWDPMGVHAGAQQTVGISGVSQCSPLSSPFVPVDLFPGFEAMGILCIQSGSLHATGSGKLISSVGRANRKGNNCRGKQLFMSEVELCLGQPEPQWISPQFCSASTSPSLIPLELLLPLVPSSLLSRRSTGDQ